MHSKNWLNRGLVADSIAHTASTKVSVSEDFTKYVARTLPPNNLIFGYGVSY